MPATPSIAHRACCSSLWRYLNKGMKAELQGGAHRAASCGCEQTSSSQSIQGVLQYQKPLSLALIAGAQSAVVCTAAAGIICGPTVTHQRRAVSSAPRPRGSHLQKQIFLQF